MTNGGKAIPGQAMSMDRREWFCVVREGVYWLHKAVITN